MATVLNLIETTTELGLEVVEVVVASSSTPGPAGPGVPVGGTDGQVLTKTSATDYATAWEDPTGGGGGGAPTDVDYLVGTASGDLSAEIVVGTSPGGELGGTWASPTVDATHSGSSHASVQAAAEATAAGALSAHSADTTSVHGFADTSAVALTANHPSNATFEDHSARHEDGGADEISIAGLSGTSAALQAHLDDTADAHDASAISIADAGSDFDATDVEGALAELQADHETDATNLTNHLNDTSDAHDASAISVADSGGYFTGTEAEAALQEAGEQLNPLLDYTEITGNVTVSGTSAAAPTTVITADEITVDGSTEIEIFVAFPSLVVPGNAAGNNLVILLFSDSTDLGRVGQTTNLATAGNFRVPLSTLRRFTPSAGTPQYSIRMYRTNANCTVEAGSGGADTFLPASITIRKVF